MSVKHKNEFICEKFLCMNEQFLHEQTMPGHLEQNDGKILVISDVHGLIPAMNDFFKWLVEDNKQKISYAVHLGDFWNGRNYNGRTQVRDEWIDLEYLDHLALPLFHIKGNADLQAPDSWWLTSRMCLMPEQRPFVLGNYKILPLDYKLNDEKEDAPPAGGGYSERDIDFIFTHRPPYGLLDHTLHYQTHTKLKNTGSQMVRHYVDVLKPKLTLFGHFHYSNALETEWGLVASLDKLVRRSFGLGRKNKISYSYGLIDPFENAIEIYWKSRLFVKYSFLEHKMLYFRRHDRRNLT